jgi:hypothetical protein
MLPQKSERRIVATLMGRLMRSNHFKSAPATRVFRRRLTGRPGITIALGSVVRNAKMSFVVSPSSTLRTEVQRVHISA